MSETNQARRRLGQFLKHRREEMGYDLETLADKIGVTPNTLRGIESGRFAWGIDLHNRLCEALGIGHYFAKLKIK